MGWHEGEGGVGSSLSTSPPCRLDHISHEEAFVEPVQ